ncbi:uncharacterized protein TNCV_2328421 [Trichonephila clavipes]|nr:uncharacterized protein TNCV_2328421 [Trichonephila clavipes]
MWPLWSHKLKRDSTVKTSWCQSACQALWSWARCRRSRQWFAMRGMLYKGTLARNPWCSRHRRIDQADICTPVAVDQRAANCLDEVVRSFTAMWSRCRSSRTDITFRLSLPVFPRSARQSTSSKLASLWNCFAAQELLLRDRKVLLLKSPYSTPAQTPQVVGIFPYFVVEAYWVSLNVHH